MKKVFTSYPLFIIGLVALVSCNGISVDNAEVSDLKWLEGKWKGSTNGTTVKERWKQLTGQSINGSAYIIKKDDTTGIRAFRIESTENKLILSLQRSANETPVGYELTKIKKNMATFANPEARYPDKISFELKKDSLIEKWSGKRNGQEITSTIQLSKVGKVE